MKIYRHVNPLKKNGGEGAPHTLPPLTTERLYMELLNICPSSSRQKKQTQSSKEYEIYFFF